MFVISLHNCTYILHASFIYLSIHPSILTKTSNILLSNLGTHRESIRICGVYNPGRCDDRTRFGWCDITWHNLEDSETQRFHPTCGKLNAYVPLQNEIDPCSPTNVESTLIHTPHNNFR